VLATNKGLFQVKFRIRTMKVVVLVTKIEVKLTI